jgi:glycine cleavage system H protein
MRKFSKDHEWVDVTGTQAVVGITNHAQHLLGDVVFVDLPAVGAIFQQGAAAAAVESVKAASEVYAPLSGSITHINEAITSNPALVNEGAETTAWFFTMQLSNPAELDALLNEADYLRLVG